MAVILDIGWIRLEFAMGLGGDFGDEAGRSLGNTFAADKATKKWPRTPLFRARPQTAPTCKRQTIAPSNGGAL
jgi:hypothetical protein